MIERLWQDVRYAGRTFARSPGFALIAILTIAIGVGANAAIFSVVHATLLRPLPYPHPDSLVIVAESDKARRSTRAVSPANFLDWRARNRSFTAMAAYRETTVALSAGDHPERRRAAMVNANFFDVLQVAPALGRTFAASDEVHGAARVAVISDTLWRERFGGRQDVIGQGVRFEDEPYTIVGVMPPGIDYPGKAELWIPPHWPVPDDSLLSAAHDPSTQRNHSYFSALARLKPGVTFDGAAADMDIVAASLERDYPKENKDDGAAIVRLRDDLVGGNIRTTTLLLFAAVGLLLLIAAANVSGLLMARATARHQEIALRAALGATRGRIVSQLLTESLLLAIVGGAGGVLLAMWLVPALVSLSPSDLTIAGDVTIDRTVLLFGLGISTLAGLLFGLAPARQMSRLNVNEDLKQTARGSTSARQRRLRGVLVTSEIALSLVLLVAAGLTIRSFVNVQRVSSGFDPEHVVTVSLSPSSTRYTTQVQRADFWERSVQAVGQIPGVLQAGAVSRLPLLPGNSMRGLTIKGLPDGGRVDVNYRTASPHYFSVMGISLLRGRAFEDGDREGKPLVAIVNHAAAQRFWPERDPIGQHFQINEPGPEYTVVGVAGDVRTASLERQPQPTLYVPYRQDAFPIMTLALKTSISTAALTNAIRAAVWQVDKDQPVGAVLTMDDQLSHSLQRRRFSVTLLSIFGTIAVLLAAIGLYGVLAFIVSQRRREIGVRIALGATTRDVITDVLGQGLRLAAVGLAVGLAMALAVTRLMSALLFGTSPTDVVTFVGAAALLTLIAATASLIPALRASRVDPLVALRDE